MRSEMTESEITRRQLLQTTGATFAVSILGGQPAAAEESCQGVELESAGEEFPEISLRESEPAASNVPDTSALVVYIHGYDTSPDVGRRLAATFEAALSEESPPVVAASWRAAHDQEATTAQEEGEKFAQAETNADEDAEKLAAWLRENAGERTIRLVGYSLGARVALHTVDALADSSVDLGSVSLLGPAVPSASVCAEGGYDLAAARAVFSYRSENDSVICEVFAGYLTLVSADSPPAVGCQGPDCEELAANVVDRDVTDAIDDHCAYGFTDVGIVPQVEADFTTAVADARQPDDGDGSTDDDTDTADDSTNSADNDGEEDTFDDSNGPGFGIASAVAGIASTGYMLSRRLGDSSE